MSITTGRKLVDRWRAGMGEANLARVLEILVAAAEAEAVSVENAVVCSADTAITTTSDVDITGATVTFVPPFDGRIDVAAYFKVRCDSFGAITHLFSGALTTNGTAHGRRAEASAAALNHVFIVPAAWSLLVASGTSYTIKLQAKTSNTGTQFTVLSANTYFIRTNVPNAFKVP